MVEIPGFIQAVLYIILGALAAMIYSLRRIFILEKRILALDKNILTIDKKISKAIVKKKRKK